MLHPYATFMQAAIEKAEQAAADGDYPVGAVIVSNEDIISAQHTRVHSLCDPTAHAEILVIREAAIKLNKHDLSGCFLYTTLEPCPMCTAAAIWANLKGIVFGATTADGIAVTSQNRTETHDWRQIDIPTDCIIRFGAQEIELYPRFMREQCKKLLNIKV